jgi:hypothetical protein
VQFKDGAGNLGSPVALSASGEATFTTSALSVGAHSITAVYSGTANLNGNTSAALVQTINKASSTTAVVASINPSLFGQSVSFTVTVTAVAPGTGTPSGEVQFKDGASNLAAPVALNASGQATLTT